MREEGKEGFLQTYDLLEISVTIQCAEASVYANLHRIQVYSIKKLLPMTLLFNRPT